ncbi:MAG TPA: hypothetical protein PK048_03020, partial [Candidatus Absconditabacterales bacterium]|nr:hypothetical protein [Candidatus Absconditabacterales bacterium]
MIRLSYDLLEQNALDTKLSLEHTNTPLGGLEETLKQLKKEDQPLRLENGEKLGEKLKNLPMIDQLKQDLMSKGYKEFTNQSDGDGMQDNPDFWRQALLIEYLKSATKITGWDDTSFERILSKFTKNPQSGTTRNERRFLQAYLFINNYYQGVSGVKSIFDEIDGAIGPKTKQAIQNYKTSKKNNQDNQKRNQPKQVDESETVIVDHTLNFIKKYEGFKGQAYRDSKGRSVGYGFHYIDGRKVTSKDSLTRTQADKLLVKKIESHQTRKQKINIPLNKEQQTALTSFEYNVGSNIRNTDSGNKIIASIEEN